MPFKDAEEGFDVDIDFTDEEDVDADGGRICVTSIGNKSGDCRSRSVVCC